MERHSLRLDVGRLNDWPPFLDFSLLERTERFRCLLLDWRDFQKKIGKAIADEW
jgi:hypothetical protein